MARIQSNLDVFHQPVFHVRDCHAEVANLRTTGCNGMHRYNNQDHSMLSAKYAVECLLDPARDRDAAWEINAEEEYHEEVRR
jgi:hypothetical protein